MGLPVDFLYASLHLESTFVDGSGSRVRKYGTGFWIHREGRIFLVTARHVVDAKWDQPNRHENILKYATYVLESITSLAWEPSRDRRRFQIATPACYFDPSNINHDVAVIPVQNVIFLDAVGAPLTINNWISFDDLATDQEFISDIWACDQVAFSGFGEWEEEAEHNPIFRTGFVASDPRRKLDFPSAKGDALVIEAFSTKGMSGAPVFAPEYGYALGSGLSLTGGRPYRRARLIGVVSSYLLAHDHQHSQLSIVFKSTVIRRIIEALP
jgi:hypothetical protein